MLGKFWEGVGGGLADRLGAVAASALVFWVGGALVWGYSRGGLGHLEPVSRWLGRQGATVQLVAVAAVLLAVAGSGVVVARLTFPVLRLLEGYWPRWCDPLRGPMVRRIERRAVDEDGRWQKLALGISGGGQPVTPDQRAEYVRLDRRKHRRPGDATRYMPTRIGNILRAAESQPEAKYGLDAVVVWPRLWLVLPDATRAELVAARAALDAAVSAVIWGLLFCVFAIWTPIAIPVGLIIAVSAVLFWVPDRAEVFGDLLEAAYDLYRADLYRQLRWPLPADPAQERACGQRLTSYLWRGSDRPDPVFTPTDPG